MKPIAVVTDYLGLIRAFRARVVELGINYETLDAIAGWSDRYASKLLSEEPPRRFGPMAFDAAIGALAVKLLVVPDPEMARYIKRHRHFVPRRARAHAQPAEQSYIIRRISRENVRQWGRLATIARMKKISPAKRSAIARKAAKARWSQPMKGTRAVTK